MYIRVRDISIFGYVGDNEKESVVIEIAKGEKCAIFDRTNCINYLIRNVLMNSDFRFDGNFFIGNKDIICMEKEQREQWVKKYVEYIIIDKNIFCDNENIVNQELQKDVFSILKRERSINFVGLKRSISLCKMNQYEQILFYIARALALGKKYLVLDNIFCNLSKFEIVELVELICRLNKKGITVIVFLAKDKGLSYFSNCIVLNYKAKVDNSTIRVVEDCGEKREEICNLDTSIDNDMSSEEDKYREYVYDVFFSMFEIIEENGTFERNSLRGKKLIEDFGFDSVAIIQFCCELERVFGIYFSIEEVIENINEIEKIIALIKSKHSNIN